MEALIGGFIVVGPPGMVGLFFVYNLYGMGRIFLRIRKKTWSEKPKKKGTLLQEKEKNGLNITSTFDNEDLKKSTSGESGNFIFLVIYTHTIHQKKFCS